MIFFAAVVTLAIVPHYSCGCGDLQEDGSLLRHFVVSVIDFIRTLIHSIVSRF